MTISKHPSKEIQAAIDHAVENGCGLLNLESPHMLFVGYIVRKKVEQGVNSPFGVPQEMKAIMQNR